MTQSQIEDITAEAQRTWRIYLQVIIDSQSFGADPSEVHSLISKQFPDLDVSIDTDTGTVYAS